MGRAIDAGKGRIFPCSACGAELEFSIGSQSLRCSYCGQVQQIELPPDKEIIEQDLAVMLDRLQTWRKEGKSDGEAIGDHEIRCDGCGANVVFVGTLTSSTCPYCGDPLQRDRIHDAQARIPVEGVLPFLVDREVAAENLRNWVKSLWFAPNQFLRDGVRGKFQGVYLPYFTFDALTYNRYTGQRGDNYWVTVQQGNTTRQEMRTRWSGASGEFQRFFDDVLTLGISEHRAGLAEGLEPWPLTRTLPFTQAALAGFFARTYDLELEACFRRARERMDRAIYQDTTARIGGDQQSSVDIKTHYGGLTFKHLLLPVWLLAYTYKGHVYQVMLNAATGQVSGERPYSWAKIAFAVSVATILAIGVFALTQSN